MHIEVLQKEVHRIAIEKGWYDKPRGFEAVIALAHSELSEALEDYRDGHEVDAIRRRLPHGDEVLGKPLGIPIEFADLIIRILDTCEHLSIDIVKAIELKNEYNRLRPYRHGGKVV